jgi:hypothetical protein
MLRLILAGHAERDGRGLEAVFVDPASVGARRPRHHELILETPRLLSTCTPGDAPSGIHVSGIVTKYGIKAHSYHSCAMIHAASGFSGTGFCN